MSDSLEENRDEFVRAAEALDLSNREKKALRLFVGAEDIEPVRPYEIGLMLGLDEDDVVGLLAGALQRIRNQLVHSGEYGALYAHLRLKLGLPDDSPARTEPLGVTIELGHADSEDLAALYSALSNAFRAHGGAGLIISEDETHLDSIERALV